MKDMIKRIREEREGFTLAELLIVVAIIAVLVAIAIPVFSAQLEKSREATDLANARAAYAEVMADALTENTTDLTSNSSYSITYATGVYTATVTCKQKQDGWQSDNVDTIGGLNAPAGVGSGKKITITYTVSTGKATISAGE